MTPATLAERKAELGRAVDRTRGELSKVLTEFQPGSTSHTAIRDANVKLSELLFLCSTLADALIVYADPAFYAELPPSRAIDDQGQRARNALERALPE